METKALFQAVLTCQHCLSHTKTSCCCTKNAGTWLWRKTQKGSPEAKAFMARLRAMRKGRRKGGMFKGVTHAQLCRLVADAEQAGRDPFTVTDANE